MASATASSAPVMPPAAPLGVGAIADRAVALYRSEFLLLFSTAFLPHAALYVFNVAMLLLGPSGGFFSQETASGIWMVSSPLLMAGTFFVSFLRLGALTWVAAQRYLGRPAGIGESFRVGLRYWLPFFATSLMGTAVTVVGFVVGMVPGGLLALAVGILIENRLVAFVVGLMLFAPFLALGFFFFLRFLFAVYIPLVPIFEGQWAVAALKRSWDLMGYRSPGWGRFSSNPYRATALFLLLGGVYFSCVFLAEVPNYLLVAWQAWEQMQSGGPTFTDPTATAPLWLLIPAQLTALTAQALILPLTVTIFTVYYFDLRSRREGFDLFAELDATASES